MLEMSEIVYALFPAHAGVILVRRRGEIRVPTFPRTRGGDPLQQPVTQSMDDFSPHVRG